MMIGIDIEEVNRFINKSEAFYIKIFTDQEIKYAKSYSYPEQHFAGMFCAKEAVMKALGCGAGRVSFSDIEICRHNGKPFVVLYNTALQFFKNLNLNKIEISISHTKQYATAMCIIN